MTSTLEKLSVYRSSFFLAFFPAFVNQKYFAVPITSDLGRKAQEGYVYRAKTNLLDKIHKNSFCRKLGH